jgi:hypothetical protein
MTKDELIDLIKEFPGDSFVSVSCSLDVRDPGGAYDLINPVFHPQLNRIIFEIGDD